MDYAAARFKMVENQVRTNRVTDPLVIAALNELPRETFLPDSLKGVAYVDEDIPLGGGRYLMEPLATALILQTAEIEPEDKILVVACGTGYLAAAAARIGRVVVALEEDSNIAAGARENISQTGASAVTVVEGRLAEGYPPEAPYDVILFNGAAADVPSAILDQLAEGAGWWPSSPPNTDLAGERYFIESAAPFRAGSPSIVPFLCSLPLHPCPGSSSERRRRSAETRYPYRFQFDRRDPACQRQAVR